VGLQIVCGEPEALETRRSENQAGCATLAPLAEPGADVATQRLDREVRAQLETECLAAQRSSENSCPRGKILEARAVVADQEVCRVCSLRESSDSQAVCELHRQVFQAMYGEIDLAGEKAPLELFGEQALASELG
jgi:hypothetical protein